MNSPSHARADSRMPQLLDAAAAQFAARGYEAASIRDIVRSVGMLPGSVYCHFANKDELLAAVYGEGVRRICQAVAAAADQHTDPWARLEAACVAHLEALLDQSAYAKVIVSVQPESVPGQTTALIALRDGYERQIIGLLDALPLRPDADRFAARVMLLGALNWTPTWFRPQRSSPAEIARSFLAVLRSGV